MTQNTFTVGARTYGPNNPLLIAEFAGEHLGSERLASQMIDAVRCMSAVKFQFHTAAECHPDLRVGHNAATMRERVLGTQLPVEALRRLRDKLRAQHRPFLCTAYCEEGFRTVDRELIPDAHKIGSGEADNPLVCETVARLAAARRIPVIYSTGMTDLRTVETMVTFMRGLGATVIPLECLSHYPAYYARFDALLALRERFGLAGWSDHSPGNDFAILAMGLGACVIEKHVTFGSNRAFGGPDAPSSIDPGKFVRLAETAHTLRSGINNWPDAVEKKMTEIEAQTAEWAHHSLVAARHIAAGATITRDDLTTMRPGPTFALPRGPESALPRGLSFRARGSAEADAPDAERRAEPPAPEGQRVAARDVATVIGKRAAREIEAGEFVVEKDLG